MKKNCMSCKHAKMHTHQKSYIGFKSEPIKQHVLRCQKNPPGSDGFQHVSGTDSCDSHEAREKQVATIFKG